MVSVWFQATPAHSRQMNFTKENVTNIMKVNPQVIQCKKIYHKPKSLMPLLSLHHLPYVTQAQGFNSIAINLSSESSSLCPP